MVECFMGTFDVWPLSLSECITADTLRHVNVRTSGACGTMSTILQLSFSCFDLASVGEYK